MNEEAIEEGSDYIASLSQEEIDLRKVFIDRVPGKITKRDIEEEFSKHGPLLEVVKYQDRKDSKRHYAFVTYKYPQDCAKATNNPTPMIKGERVECWLAAIGASYSGFKFFRKNGFLTSKLPKNKNQKQNQNRRNKDCNNNNGNNGNNSNNSNNNNNNVITSHISNSKNSNVNTVHKNMARLSSMANTRQSKSTNILFGNNNNNNNNGNNNNINGRNRHMFNYQRSMSLGSDILNVSRNESKNDEIDNISNGICGLSLQLTNHHKENGNSGGNNNKNNNTCKIKNKNKSQKKRNKQRNNIQNQNVSHGQQQQQQQQQQGGVYGMPFVQLVENSNRRSSHVFDNVLQNYHAMKTQQQIQSQSQSQCQNNRLPQLDKSQMRQDSRQGSIGLQKQFRSTPKLFSEHYTQRYPNPQSHDSHQVATTTTTTTTTTNGMMPLGEFDGNSDLDNPYSMLYYEEFDLPRALTWHGNDNFGHTMATIEHQRKLIHSQFESDGNGNRETKSRQSKTKAKTTKIMKSQMRGAVATNEETCFVGPTTTTKLVACTQSDESNIDCVQRMPPRPTNSNNNNNSNHSNNGNNKKLDEINNIAINELANVIPNIGDLDIIEDLRLSSVELPNSLPRTPPIESPHGSSEDELDNQWPAFDLPRSKTLHEMETPHMPAKAPRLENHSLSHDNLYHNYQNEYNGSPLPKW